MAKAERYQTGGSSRRADKKRRAKAPGKRKSKSGKIYTERRRNRSDMSPKQMLGIKLRKFPKKPSATATQSTLQKYLKKVRSIESENAKRTKLAQGIGRILSK